MKNRIESRRKVCKESFNRTVSLFDPSHNKSPRKRDELRNFKKLKHKRIDIRQWKNYKALDNSLFPSRSVTGQLEAIQLKKRGVSTNEKRIYQSTCPISPFRLSKPSSDSRKVAYPLEEA